MPIDDIILDEQRKVQLDNNIKSMIESGIDEDGVMAYAKDFKTKFGKKKSVGFSQELPPPTMPSGEKLQQVCFGIEHILPLEADLHFV